MSPKVDAITWCENYHLRSWPPLRETTLYKVVDDATWSRWRHLGWIQSPIRYVSPEMDNVIWSRWCHLRRTLPSEAHISPEMSPEESDTMWGRHCCLRSMATPERVLTPEMGNIVVTWLRHHLIQHKTKLKVFTLGEITIFRECQALSWFQTAFHPSPLDCLSWAHEPLPPGNSNWNNQPWQLPSLQLHHPSLLLQQDAVLGTCLPIVPHSH